MENTIKKTDLTHMKSAELFGYIYSIYSKGWLWKFRSYEQFAEMVQADGFILTEGQWAYLLAEWEEKEAILNERIYK